MAVTKLAGMASPVRVGDHLVCLGLHCSLSPAHRGPEARP